MSQIDELRTTIAKKDEEIIGCRKAIDRLQTSVQQLTCQLEKSQKNANMDSAKLSALQNKADELPFSPLAYRWLVPFTPGQDQKSEVFGLPLIRYRFYLSVRYLQDGSFCVDLIIYRGYPVEPCRRIDGELSCFSIKLYLIGQTNDKSTEKIFVNEIFNDYRDRTVSLKADGINIIEWVINNKLHIFCKINQIRLTEKVVKQVSS